MCARVCAWVPNTGYALKYDSGSLVAKLAPSSPPGEAEEEAAVTSTGAQLRINGGGRVVINPGGTLRVGD